MKNILNFDKFLKESVFVAKEEVDTLLDKISLSGISSLSDKTDLHYFRLKIKK